LTGEQIAQAGVARGKLLEIMADRMAVAEASPRDRAAAGNGRAKGPRVSAYIGPTGVGKTTTIAKLAANYKIRERRKVGMITIDTYRIAAVDQLKTYAELIEVPLHVVLTPG
jgi:flagellar biosynthesis GTPase FlhF